MQNVRSLTLLVLLPASFVDTPYRMAQVLGHKLNNLAGRVTDSIDSFGREYDYPYYS